MTSTVECLFVTPTGEPIANAPVEVQPAKSGYLEELDGIVMPRGVNTQTDANGRCLVELWPSPVAYYVRCSDLVSEAEVFYKFQVPVVNPGVVLRLQDLTFEPGQAAAPSNVRVELVSTTEYRITVIGLDGVSRSSINNLP